MDPLVMTAIDGSERAIPRGRPLLWAAGVAATYAIAMAVVGLACANFLARADNLGALAITFLCAAVLVLARDRREVQYLALFSAGILVGLYLQPSTAFIVAAFVAVMAVRYGMRARSRATAFAVLLLGSVTGVALLFGLMRLITSSDLRC